MQRIRCLASSHLQSDHIKKIRPELHTRCRQVHRHEPKAMSLDHHGLVDAVVEGRIKENALGVMGVQ